MPLSYEDVCQLVTAFEDSDWDEMSIVHDGTSLVLSRNGAATRGIAPASASAPVTPSAPARSSSTAGASAGAAGAASPATGTTAAGATSAGEPAPASGPPADGQPIPSPSVGLFWRSPQPGAPPFVDVGQSIGPDDTVCIIEVMKLMNHVKAGVSGTVVAVLPENGHMVELGQPLFLIDPAG
jgi:acetyl-CoA carboxylase biotin carboxyl carrier protein